MRWRPTGIAQYTLALAKEFGQIAPDEVELLVKPYHRLLLGRHLGLRAHAQLSRNLASARLPNVDVVHGPNFHPFEHPTARSVATVHDLGYLEFPECHPPGMPERLDALIRSWLPRASMWLCDSEDTRAAFAATYSVESERTCVAPLGVDTGRFCPVAEPGERARVIAKSGMDRPYLLFVGAMVPRKDLGTLVAAFEQVADDTPDIGLILAGNKTLRWASDWPKVEAWLERRPDLAHRVSVLNYVPADMLPALYRHCEAVLLTSLLEGFGLTLLEGLASGRPVVASRVGALAEIGGTAAYYGERRNPESFARAIRQALDGEDAARRTEEATSIVRKHTWTRTAQKTLRAYRQAMGA